MVVEDKGFSGGNLKRPSLKRMMEIVRKHKFCAIAVYRLDRISRNVSDFTGVIDELPRLAVSFVSIREQFDTSMPMGRVMMYIISVFSQLDRVNIAERIRDKMHELAKTGRWLRHSRGLMQKEVAAKIGMSHNAYKSIEEGATRQISTEMRDRLARFYDVANEDLIDAFNRFLLDGQANRIRAIRGKTGLSQREFAGQMGIPVQGLEAWENEKRAVTYKSWEKYFKGRT